MWAMTDLGIPGVGDAALIASGGSALVYEALSGTGERLAVKVLQGIHGSEVTRRFDREITAGERLEGHPHIMRILHSGLTGADEPYLVMPLYPAGSLNDELEQTGAFPLHRATGDVAMVADALEFAHQRGVLHRDIKPGNIMRANNGSIVVTDFGIARVVDAGITSATIGASTPLYAAPEVLAENEASVRSEIYGLGALLYALLAGRASFSGSDNIWATMNRIRTETPPPILGVPAPVMRVIEQAMAKRPADRPASAQHFRENLRIALTADDSWRPPLPITVELTHNDVVLGPSMRDEISPSVVTPTFEAPRLASPTLLPPVAPPPPARHRPAPAAGTAPSRDSSLGKILSAAAVLVLVAALGWWGTSQLLNRNQISDAVVAPPVDNSLPSPGSETNDSDTNDSDTNDSDTNDSDTNDDQTPTDSDDVNIDDLPRSPQIPNTFVSFAGDHFSALFPEGWALAARDVDEGYGFRSRFVNNDMYLNVDTTPKEQREPGGDISESARDIAAGIASASLVRTEEIDGLVMHSFTFRNQQGVGSIDIFFEVDGDGYAVVAGSATDPDTAFATARLVALSIRSNPS